MKKIKILSLLIGIVFVLGFTQQAHALFIGDLGVFGVAVPLPIAPPTTIDVIGGGLRTKGDADFAVLYNAGTGVYSYFYQVKNIGGGVGEPLARFTIDNPYLVPLIGSGIKADLLDPVTLNLGLTTSFGVNLDPAGDRLTVGQTTNRFYFQFFGPPGVVSGYLIDGGIGSGPVIGPVPEPASMMLLGMGILGLFGLRKKRVA